MVKICLQPKVLNSIFNPMITEVKVGTEKLSDLPFFLGLGSCFVNNLTPFLNEWGYDYIYNPLGTTFNPISIAKQLNIPYLYLGYWIKDHLSMGYKENYKPFEILQNRPTLEEKTIWSYYE